MAIASLQPLRKSLLSENVVGSIRAAILEGAFDLGQRLVETELADQLGVSRGPIREALRLLAAEGLVVINVHRGTFVVEPAVADVEEIYSLREALEVLAVQRIVKLAEDKEIEELVEGVRRFQAASDSGQAEKVVVVNMEFHSRLFKLARHSRLSQIWATLESQLHLCNSMGLERPRSSSARPFDDHLKILDAIQRRDAEEACRLMSRHIQDAAQAAREAANPS
jgi:DNA-binding GntR family transcriptional regulator